MPIAKSAPSTAPIVEVAPKSDKLPESCYAGKAADTTFSQHIYNYFGINEIERYSEEKNNILKEIIEWTGEQNVPFALKKLQALEIKLGATPAGMTKLTQIYNWTKLSSQIDKLHAERDIYGKVIEKAGKEVKDAK